MGRSRLNSRLSTCSELFGDKTKLIFATRRGVPFRLCESLAEYRCIEPHHHSRKKEGNIEPSLKTRRLVAGLLALPNQALFVRTSSSSRAGRGPPAGLSLARHRRGRVPQAEHGWVLQQERRGRSIDRRAGVCLSCFKPAGRVNQLLLL